MIDIWTVEDAGLDALDVESRRIKGDGVDTHKPRGLVRDAFYVSCPGTASSVLQKARDVMGIVNLVSKTKTWPSDTEWPDRLPSWFVDACMPENAEEARDALPDDLPLEERKAKVLARRWRLLSWTYWMEPCEREWMWWSADIRDPDTTHIIIDRLGDPSPGHPPGLWWLFSAAGATAIDEDCYD